MTTTDSDTRTEEPDHPFTPQEQQWVDTKKYAWVLSLIPAAIPLIIWGLVEWMRATTAPDLLIHATWWLGPIAIFILIPLGDFVLGRDGENAPEEFVPW
ncbi:MAG: alkane 1-monooxygenase, partial [Mycobacteriaceae bacterium]